MTITKCKTLLATIALSAMAFTSTAQAGTNFNKFPAHNAVAQSQNSHIQTRTTVRIAAPKISMRKNNVTRIVKATPSVKLIAVSKTKHHGTKNVSQSFNKMAGDDISRTSAMPSYFDSKANNAR